MSTGSVAVDNNHTGLLSTQHTAATSRDRCMRTFRCPRGGMFTLLVDFRPANDDGKPLDEFFTVPVHQNPRANNDIARGMEVKKLSTTIVCPRFSNPRTAFSCLLTHQASWLALFAGPKVNKCIRDVSVHHAALVIQHNKDHVSPMHPVSESKLGKSVGAHTETGLMPMPKA